MTCETKLSFLRKVEGGMKTLILRKRISGHWRYYKLSAARAEKYLAGNSK